MKKITLIAWSLAALLPALAPAASAPGTPTNVLGTVLPDGEARVTFTAAPHNGSPITAYTVIASPGGLVGSGNSSPITLFGLSPNVTYTFTVQAMNAIGFGPVSEVSAPVSPAALRSGNALVREKENPKARSFQLNGSRAAKGQRAPGLVFQRK